MYAVSFKVSHNTCSDFEDAVADYRGRIEYENDMGDDKYIEGRIVFEEESRANEFVNNKADLFLYISKYWEV